MGRQQYIARLALGRSAYESAGSGILEGPTIPGPTTFDSVQPGSVTSDQYIQEYDSGGRPINPTSRAMARAMIRAQNDVLATVGVCYGIAPGERLNVQARYMKKQRDQLELIMRENEIGLFVGAGDLGLLWLGNWWLDGIRRRVQVFRTFAELSFREMFWIELKHHGFFTIIGAGMPAHVAFLLLLTGWDHLQSELVTYLHRKNSQISNNTVKRRNKRLIKYLDRALKFSSYIFLSPLMIFSSLQSLNLLPGYPLLPPVKSFVPLSAASPLQLPAMPNNFTPRAIIGLIHSIIMSPVGVFYIWYTVRETIDYRAFQLIRSWVTKPDNPDTLSIKGAIEEDLDGGHIPGLGGSFDREELDADVEDGNSSILPIESLRGARDWLMSLLMAGVGQPAGEPGLVSESATSEWSAAVHVLGMAARRRLSESILDEDSGVSIQGRLLADATYQPNGPGGSSPAWRPVRIQDDSSPSPMVLSHITEPGEGEVTSAQPSLRSSPEPSGDHLPTATGTSHSQMETEAADMGLEVTHNPPLYANNLSASPAAEPENAGSETSNVQPFDLSDPYLNEVADRLARNSDLVERHSAPFSSSRERGKRQEHRVTTLSSHPADVVATHISNYVATWATLPLETIFLRTITYSFLAAASTPMARENAAFFLGNMYPLARPAQLARSVIGRGFGGVFSVGLGTAGRGFAAGVGYASQLAITNLTQLLVSWTVFQLGYSGVIWVGKKWFNWGQL